ncbi:hypothetical protein OE88DRAFT_1665323 [Heliocybe sulcata]|uniref:Uncharacterized protein n=1 Tax=Heliocybe sulcata TaxID=5364 RepID=A0A5C3MTF4_9AGAM|nr:hypothetical protein OE88DRAFT_1665323 [Heliocybe sulcata]
MLTVCQSAQVQDMYPLHQANTLTVSKPAGYAPTAVEMSRMLGLDDADMCLLRGQINSHGNVLTVFDRLLSKFDSYELWLEGDDGSVGATPSGTCTCSLVLCSRISMMSAHSMRSSGGLYRLLVAASNARSIPWYWLTAKQRVFLFRPCPTET